MSRVTSAPIEDRLAILDLGARYCRGLDKQHREEFLSSFWDDGVLASSLAGGDFVGHDGIGEWFDKVHTDPSFEPYLNGQHRPANVLIDEFDGDRATVWCQFELLTQPDGVPKVSSYGEYHDRLSKRDGEWRISHRVIHLVANAP